MIMQSATLRKIASTFFISRMSNSFSSFNKYPFLAELGLSQENHGAYYNGQWTTTDSKATFTTINPGNEEVIATTKCASLKDYEKAIDAMQTANK
jgi:hypothetical protein